MEIVQLPLLLYVARLGRIIILTRTLRLDALHPTEKALFILAGCFR